jgi:hypothetical protein
LDVRALARLPDRRQGLPDRVSTLALGTLALRRSEVTEVGTTKRVVLAEDHPLKSRALERVLMVETLVYPAGLGWATSS